MLNVYKTRETSIATYLVTQGVKYLGPEEFAPGMYSFVFEDPQLCYKLEEEFLSVKNTLLKDIKYDAKSRT
jgi:hypothetical protein